MHLVTVHYLVHFVGRNFNIKSLWGYVATGVLERVTCRWLMPDMALQKDLASLKYIRKRNIA